MDYTFLMDIAAQARENAYAKYSGFKVGAALLSKSGKVFTGCNIENAAYGDTVCAERVAIFKAISEGEREFEAIAIAGGKDELNEICSPCGTCRQVMAEFCSENFKILLGRPSNFKVYKLSEILPLTFNKSNLGADL
ncbi:MAG: cytidine deaminase [Clostridiales bacterium]|nr:cytidine deaminase [Clostridiales bacterium]